MWTLIGRSAMNIFQKEDSEFFFMKVFVKYTNPIIKIFKFITPSFIIGPLVPLYVAWFFYMFRFYLMPYLMGYSVIHANGTLMIVVKILTITMSLVDPIKYLLM